MTTTTSAMLAVREQEPGGAISPVTEMEERLHQISRMLQETKSVWLASKAREQALFVQQAAKIADYTDIQVQASNLVMDAERVIAQATPPTPPQESGRMGGAGEGQRPMSDLPVDARTVSRMRSAHTGLDDEAYQTLKEQAVEKGVPLTRKHLIDQATKARLAQNVPGATKLGGLPWTGGKNFNSTLGVGRWIAGMLPYDDGPDALYCEPFGGMGGILLNRPRTASEWLNDVNGRVVNFWAALRRWPDELAGALDFTPYAEDEFLECKRTLDEGTPLERARKFCVVVAQSVGFNDNDDASWAFTIRAGNRKWPALRRVGELAERMSGVRICNRPYQQVLERLADNANAVIYCDPPYTGVSEEHEIYRHNALDVPEFCGLLRAQEGRVAVSGNEGDYDLWLPDWHRMSKEVSRVVPVTGGIHSKTRIECVWLNFNPENGERL